MSVFEIVGGVLLILASLGIMFMVLVQLSLIHIWPGAG